MKNLTTFILSFCSLFAISQQTPRILVSIVVDQMRYEYVDRFWEHFSETGFKKLANDGIFVEMYITIIFQLILAQVMQVFLREQPLLFME